MTSTSRYDRDVSLHLSKCLALNMCLHVPEVIPFTRDELSFRAYLLKPIRSLRLGPLRPAVGFVFFFFNDPPPPEIYPLPLPDPLPISIPNPSPDPTAAPDQPAASFGRRVGHLYPQVAAHLASRPGEVLKVGDITRAIGAPSSGAVRSEEHTSELQSQSNLVCRLLLEKK